MNMDSNAKMSLNGLIVRENARFHSDNGGEYINKVVDGYSMLIRLQDRNIIACHGRKERGG